MNENLKPCIWCGESIKPSARICRFCNHAQEDSQQERELYHGKGLIPLGPLFLHLMLCFAFIGCFTLPAFLLSHSRQIVRITNRKIEMRSGILSTRIEVLDLFRVKDIRFVSSFGRGQMQILSSDATTPNLVIAIPGAQEVFTELQSAITSARSAANVRMAEYV